VYVSSMTRLLWRRDTLLDAWRAFGCCFRRVAVNDNIEWIGSPYARCMRWRSVASSVLLGRTLL